MTDCPNCECARCSGARSKTDPLYEAINGALTLYGLNEGDAHAIAENACSMASYLQRHGISNAKSWDEGYEAGYGTAFARHPDVSFDDSPRPENPYRFPADLNIQENR